MNLTQIIRAIFARSQLRLPAVQPLGVVEQRRADPARKQRRQIIAHLGRRQGIKWIKHVRSQQRANRAELAQIAPAAAD